jgi:hypothetical protein
MVAPRQSETLPPQESQKQGDASTSSIDAEGNPAPAPVASMTPAYPPIMSPPKPSDAAVRPLAPAPAPTPPQHKQKESIQTDSVIDPSPRHLSPKHKASTRRARRKWTEQETNDLIMGCREHGVGNWKKVLDDPRFNFNGRSSVDLKDRYAPFMLSLIGATC